jgi:hypothetical protein
MGEEKGVWDFIIKQKEPHRGEILQPRASLTGVVGQAKPGDEKQKLRTFWYVFLPFRKNHDKTSC